MLRELNDNGWIQAFGYCGEPGTYAGDNCARPIIGLDRKPVAITVEDVVEIKHIREGEEDGPDWILVGRTKDDLWFVLRAGCDFTGWD